MNKSTAKKRLAEKLGKYVEERGLSGRELAARLEVSPNSAQAYLTGLTYPGPEIKDRIITLLGISKAQYEYEIEGKEPTVETTADGICEAIPFLSRTDLIRVYQCASERLIAELDEVAK